MIIAARIFLTEAQFAELKANGKLSEETVDAVISRTRKAIQLNSFDTITYVVDHAVNEAGQLVSVGEIPVRLDGDLSGYVDPAYVAEILEDYEEENEK